MALVRSGGAVFASKKGPWRLTGRLPFGWRHLEAQVASLPSLCSKEVVPYSVGVCSYVEEGETIVFSSHPGGGGSMAGSEVLPMAATQQPQMYSWLMPGQFGLFSHADLDEFCEESSKVHD